MRDRLSDQLDEVRQAAATSLGYLALQEPETLTVLLHVAKTDVAYEVRMAAVTAVGEIGLSTPQTLKLLEAIAIEDTAFDVRQLAVFALSELGDTAIPALERLGAIHELGRIGEAAVPALTRFLQHKSARVRAEAAEQLGDIGSAQSTDALVLLLGDDRSSVRFASVYALGRIQNPLDKGPLLEFLRSDQDHVVEAAVNAIAGAGAQFPEIIPSLLPLMTHRDSRVRSASCYALRKVGRGDPRTERALYGALEDKVQDVKQAAVAALSEVARGPDLAVRLARMLETEKDEGMCNSIIYAIGQSGACPPPVLLALNKELIRDGAGRTGDFPEAQRRGNAAYAINKLAVADDTTLLNLVELMQSNNGTIYRGYAASALSTFAIRDQAEGDHNHLTLYEDALAYMRGAEHFDPVLRRVVQPFDFEIARLGPAVATMQLSNRLRIILLVAGGLGAVLLGLMSKSCVRMIRTFLIRQRWHFTTGTCDHQVDISGIDGAWDIRHTVSKAALPVRVRVRVPASKNAVGLNELAPVVGGFRSQENVIVEAHEGAFTIPWSNILTSSWGSGGNAVIGGQVLSRKHRLLPPPPPRPFIQFSGLGCNVPCQHDVALPAADLEVATVTRVLKGWGARVTTRAQQLHSATVMDMYEALRSSDIVHVAAHTTSDGILLLDGSFGVQELLGVVDESRCRLLVVGGCNSGALGLSDAAFAGACVNNGVNVIATLNDVDDRTCRVFFEYFYKALMPERWRQGVTIADAIRVAGARTSDRLDAATSSSTLEGFILYGDPTLHLILQRGGPYGRKQYDISFERNIEENQLGSYDDEGEPRNRRVG